MDQLREDFFDMMAAKGFVRGRLLLEEEYNGVPVEQWLMTARNGDQLVTTYGAATTKGAEMYMLFTKDTVFDEDTTDMITDVIGGALNDSMETLNFDMYCDGDCLIVGEPFETRFGYYCAVLHSTDRFGEDDMYDWMALVPMSDEEQESITLTSRYLQHAVEHGFDKNAFLFVDIPRETFVDEIAYH